MIRTVVTPESQTVSIDVPQSYVGKKIEVLLYAVDELIEKEPRRTGNAASFKGIFSEAEAIQFHQYLKQARND
ncbi:MAG: hypothetical protein IAF08_14440 [Rhizobacter sp.]|nr:hypothetical protein [Chlorobiales bacterium]